MSKLIIGGTLANLAATTGVSTHFGIRLQQEREKNPKDLGWENLCKPTENQSCYIYSGKIQLHEYNVIVELYNKFCKDSTFYSNKNDLKTFCETKYDNNL